MNRGKMDRRVTLRFSVPVRNATGESTDVWVNSRTVWAQWLPQSGREFYAALARNSEITGIFRMAYFADVESRWQLIYGDDLFEVVYVQEVGRKDYIDVIVRAVNQTVGEASLDVLLLETAAAEFMLLEDDSSPLTLEPAY